MKINIVLILIFVLLPLAYAAEDDEWLPPPPPPDDECSDSQPPNAPTDLSLSGNVDVSWDAALDNPDNCTSGVDYYNIYRDDKFIDNTSSTSFSEGPLADGTYTYEVTAVDKAGNEGEAASESITIKTEEPEPQTSGGGGSGGGGGGGLAPTDLWDCEEWSECVDGEQTQECTQGIATKTDTRDCEEEVEEVTTTGSGAVASGAEEDVMTGPGSPPEPVEEDLVTGAVVGAGEKTSWPFLIVLLALILAAILLFLASRKRKKH